jgi:putative ABC transport system permease protein
MPPGQRRAIEDLAKAGGWRLRDFASATSGLSRLLNNLTLYLTLVSLTALLVGGIGVAGAVRSYLSSRAQTIATLKCLGAGRRLVFLTYLMQTLFLALVGSGLGIGLGLIAAQMLGSLLSARLGLEVAIGWQGGALALALGCGLFTALAFSITPLSAASRVSPARLFRAYSDPRPPRPAGRPWYSRAFALGRYSPLPCSPRVTPRWPGALAWALW